MVKKQNTRFIILISLHVAIGAQKSRVFGLQDTRDIPTSQNENQIGRYTDQYQAEE